MGRSEKIQLIYSISSYNYQPARDRSTASLPTQPSAGTSHRVPLITWTTEMFSSCPATFLSNCLSHLDQVQFNKQTDSSEWRWSVLPSLQGSSGWQDWKSEVDRGSELSLFGSQSHRSTGVGVQHSLKRPFLQGHREENQMLIHPLPALLALLPLCRLKIYTVSLSVSLLILNKGILDKLFIRYNLSKRYAVRHKRVSARSFHWFLNQADFLFWQP